MVTRGGDSEANWAVFEPFLGLENVKNPRLFKGLRIEVDHGTTSQESARARATLGASDFASNLPFDLSVRVVGAGKHPQRGGFGGPSRRGRWRSGRAQSQGPDGRGGVDWRRGWRGHRRIDRESARSLRASAAGL